MRKSTTPSSSPRPAAASPSSFRHGVDAAARVVVFLRPAPRSHVAATRRRVDRAQAWAALYLNHALEKFNCDKLEFLWLFSSVATYGNPGQSPYSAANSLLDSLSRYRNAKGLPCTAMQWAGSFSAS